MTLRYDTLSRSIGVELGPSRTITVNQQRIDTFAEVTEDRQWIHVDPELAAKGPFGVPISHGYLTLSLVSAFLEHLVDVDGASMAINYGLNRVRFPSPVPVGSILHATARLTAVEATGDAKQTTFEIVITAQGAEKPACVAEVLIRYRPERAE